MSVYDARDGWFVELRVRVSVSVSFSVGIGGPAIGTCPKAPPLSHLEVSPARVWWSLRLGCTMFVGVQVRVWVCVRVWVSV